MWDAEGTVLYVHNTHTHMQMLLFNQQYLILALYYNALCAKVHLHEGLYVQALSCRDLPMAVAALGTLIIMRSLCRAQTYDQRAHHSKSRKTCYDFVRHRALDLQRSIATTLSVHTLNDKLSFVFRTRFALSKSCELATPSRREPQAAIEDWVVMIWAMDALDKSFKKPTHTELSLLNRDIKRKLRHPKLFPSEVRPGRLKLLKFVSAISTMPGAVRGKMEDLGSHGVANFEDTEGGILHCPHCENLDCSFQKAEHIHNARQSYDVTLITSKLTISHDPFGSRWVGGWAWHVGDGERNGKPWRPVCNSAVPRTDAGDCGWCCEHTEASLKHIQKAIRLCSNKGSRNCKRKRQ